MTSENQRAGEDDDEGFEGPDVERSVHDEPVLEDVGDSELDDSADSYVSPARTGGSEGHEHD
ncbi:hypothetical protein [Microbacterium sp.]|uniref:hypothetical protein n=1 Tax=Microbacterium sp. TaxID=51671 RepID=UPI003F71F054